MLPDITGTGRLFLAGNGAFNFGFILLITCLTFSSFAQDSTSIVKGKVTLDPLLGFSDFIVVNLKTGRGAFGMGDGTFEIRIQSGDDILISNHGFKSVKVSFGDSVYKPVYHVNVAMKQLSIEFDKPVIIRPQPTYEDLEEAREKIGISRYDPIISSPADAFSSPFTALYQRFSRKEQEKREYAALLNKQQIENVLKDLTRYHIEAGLFELEEDELPLFIATCPLGEDFVKYASLYDVSVALQGCYAQYKNKRKY